MAILGFLWRIIHHGGHEDHEKNNEAQMQRVRKSEKSKSFVDFACLCEHADRRSLW
jgi:hypothetical protein